MGMDRNTVIGFILIGIMMVTMFVVNSRSRQQYEKEQKRINDSIAATKPKKIIDTLHTANVLVDSPAISAKDSSGFSLANNPGQSVTLENDVLKVVFSTKGAQPKQVTLKKFKRFDGSLVVLQEGNYNKLSYPILTGINQTAASNDINFTAEPVITKADGSQVLNFKMGDSSTSRIITHQYIMKKDDYMIDLAINIQGADKLFSQNALNLVWQTETPQVEKDHKYELTQMELCYLENKDYDFKRMLESGNKSFSEPLNWVAVKQQFFISGLIANNNFSTVGASWQVSKDTNSHIAQTAINAKADFAAGASNVSVPLHLYYGPSDYNILKKYGNQMQNIVPYGSGVFAFVKYINRYFLLPVFDFLRSKVASMGLVILLLTLFIRLITSPILYKSYLSGAKMRVLKPEVDQLKLKFKDPKTGQLDQQAFGMEQMKLWKSAGVNPLGGCIPALLQIPIFMSLYYFFQCNIDLRGQSFLWATDLAAYDSIYKLPFNIPFYGDHVSLFTITATLTSLLISVYSMNQMQDNSNPVMKYMPYFFPIILLGVFNNMPSALTWYYTISNTITLILQIVIQKYIIDHDKILAVMNEKKKRPVTKSKLQERIEAMQETQKKMQEMKSKTSKK